MFCVESNHQVSDLDPRGSGTQPFSLATWGKPEGKERVLGGFGGFGGISFSDREFEITDPSVLVFGSKTMVFSGICIQDVGNLKGRACGSVLFLGQRQLSQPTMISDPICLESNFWFQTPYGFTFRVASG